jgi:hypothetical protein
MMSRPPPETPPAGGCRPRGFTLLAGPVVWAEEETAPALAGLAVWAGVETALALARLTLAGPVVLAKG